MRKIVALILALIMSMFICGCKNLPLNYSYFSYEVNEIIETVPENTGASNTLENQSGVISDNTSSGNITANSSNNTDFPQFDLNDSGSADNDTPQPEPPKVETPTVDEKNDPTTENNNKLNEAIKSEIGESNPEKPDEFLEKVWKIVAESDGVTFSDKVAAKDTDKVSMLNLYEQPACTTHKEVEAELLKLVNGKSDKKFYNTKIQIIDDDLSEFISFAQEYYMVHGYQLYYGVADANLTQISSEKFIWIDISKTKKCKEDLLKTPEYKYIQDAIKECGINSNMLQKDAILKFNDYICTKVEYDYDDYSHDLVSFFEKGKATCNSYSQVFELMCRTVGIDAKFINGSVDAGPHAWNVVEFSDGSKYYFDICWNDCPVTINGKPYYNDGRITFATSITKRTVNWISPVAYMSFI